MMRLWTVVSVLVAELERHFETTTMLSDPFRRTDFLEHTNHIKVSKPTF